MLTTYKRILLSVVIIVVCLVVNTLFIQEKTSGAPPNGIAENEVPDTLIPWANWQRPDGPPKIGIQVGHWQNEKLPEELSNLIGNTGAQGGGKTEAEVNLAIAQVMKKQLEVHGVEVDLLPTVVPPDYWADAFIAIHADGSTHSNTSGFKVAAPWRDLTGSANTLVTAIETEYATLGLAKDPNITKNMRGYYAFSWWRFEHSIHPMTTAAIVETGFLTNANDRKLIVDNFEKSAAAISAGVMTYLDSEGLVRG